MTSFAINTLSSVQQALANNQTGFVGTSGNIFIQAIPLAGTGDAITGTGLTKITVMGIVGSSVEDAIEVSGGQGTRIDTGPDAVITSTAESGIVISDAVNGAITNAGTISSNFSSIIFVAADAAAIFSLINTGSIASQSNRAISVSTGSGAATILNAGMVTSVSGFDPAVSITSTALVQLVNTGLISKGFSGDTAVLVTAGQMRLDNSGQIVGNVLIVGQSTINNTGEIAGSLGLNSGVAVVNNMGTIVDDLGTGDLDDSVRNAGQIGGDLRSLGGDDTLDLRGGTVSGDVIGGNGGDTYIIDSGVVSIVEISSNTGTDIVRSSVSYALAAHVEQLEQFGSGDVKGAGNGLDNTLTGNSGDNRLNGRIGNDTLNGGDGEDTLRGGKGNDFYFTDGDDTLTENADSGNDTVSASVSLTLGNNLENLLFTGADNLSGTGNSLANTIFGTTGANTLNGMAGNDTLTGNTGADSFVFSTTLGVGNIDRISDFVVTDDTIRLDDAVFTGLAIGGLAGTAFATNTSGNAADASDRIIYETDSGKLFFDRDGTGTAFVKVQFGTLQSGLAVTVGDFLIF